MDYTWLYINYIQYYAIYNLPIIVDIVPQYINHLPIIVDKMVELYIYNNGL